MLWPFSLSQVAGLRDNEGECWSTLQNFGVIHTEHLIILAFMEINLRIGKVQLQSIESVVNGSHFTPFRLSWNALWSVGFSTECAARLATDGLLVLSLSLREIGDHIS